MRRLSLSGHERDHLFFSVHGEKFYDLAGISGLDHPGDGRSFVKLDYDRDGWQDVAVVSTNAPLLQLYRNEIGSRPKAENQMIALRFVGGNHTAAPSRLKGSNRDGYGAMATIKLGDLTLIREHRAGEGFAAQNSATLIIGLGKRAAADSLIVRWPSGIIQKTGRISAGMLATVYEVPGQQPEGKAFVLQPYQRSSQAAKENERAKASRPQELSSRRLQLTHKSLNGPAKQLRLYTTMATWCATCKGELPQFERLRARFDKNKLEIFGIPVDDSDDTKKLKTYVAKYRPAYKMLMDLEAAQVAAIKQLVKDNLKLDGLPATIITDGEGNVLRTRWGAPAVSEIEQLLADLSPGASQKQRSDKL